MPSAASGTNIVMYREAWLAVTDTGAERLPGGVDEDRTREALHLDPRLHAEASAIA